MSRYAKKEQYDGVNTRCVTCLVRVRLRSVPGFLASDHEYLESLDIEEYGDCRQLFNLAPPDRRAY